MQEHQKTAETTPSAWKHSPQNQIACCETAPQNQLACCETLKPYKHTIYKKKTKTIIISSGRCGAVWVQQNKSHTDQFEQNRHTSVIPTYSKWKCVQHLKKVHSEIPLNQKQINLKQTHTWSHGIINPIYKSGNKLDPNNYYLTKIIPCVKVKLDFSKTTGQQITFTTYT